MDTELFELCKEVYKRTGWKMVDNFYFYAWTANGHKLTDVTEKKFKGKGYDDLPIYTSDYLLEKLPYIAKDQWQFNHYGPNIEKSSKVWTAYYGDLGTEPFIGTSDTPLKALLKLTIALSEAGELK